MSPELIVTILVLLIIIATFGILVSRKIPKRLKSGPYVRKWREIQKLCNNKEDWSHAIIYADMLLDEAMIKKRVVGKTMGERLVNSRSKFTSNDAIWKAHKLASSLREDGVKQMSEAKVKDTLITFRMALRDLGAL